MIMKDESPQLLQMHEPTHLQFSSQDERRAYEARQLLWMRYEDHRGHITERVVEVYKPGEGEMILTWCRLQQEPRAFARHRIKSWRLLPERFTFEPMVAQYWNEERGPDMWNTRSWRLWLQQQYE